jgi:hypothetical protein
MQFVILTSLMHVHAISIHYEKFFYLRLFPFHFSCSPANMFRPTTQAYIAYFMSFICFNSCTWKIIRIA